ncbi:MAG: 2-oxoacid:acceptor oxidoreductase family protein, partial [Victivallaceae bacterium]
QGDGDLGAIGLAEIMHAANRGENICVVFINNAIYGMTGGQMAPTTLVGQKTITTPDGRKMELDGSPMRISELIAALDAPIYVERAVLSTPSEIMKARKALRKAIKNTIERKGFSFVELLSGCPVGLKSDPVKINDFLDSQLAEIFPPGVFRDCAATAPEKSMPVPVTDAERIIELLTADEKCSEAVTPNGVFPEILRIKIAGAGGQGVLSLGALLAQIGKMAGYYVSFLPAYGPEMRGGTANCSVIISRSLIAAPVVDNKIDLLIALNEPSLLRYENAVNSNGRIVYDASACSMPEKTNMIQLPGGSLAAGQLGNVKAGNIILLGACIASWGKPNNQQEKLYNLAQAAIAAQFSGNAGVMQLNLAALELGMNTLEQN